MEVSRAEIARYCARRLSRTNGRASAFDLPHIKAPTLPFPTQEFGNAGRFALFGVVTNRLTMPGDALIRWHRECCGMSEKHMR
jgi:hypothetical protein